MVFSSRNFNILTTLHIDYIRLVIPLNFFFLENGRNYITVLVSHNVIFFGYFMHIAHGVNRKTPPSAFPHLSHLY